MGSKDFTGLVLITTLIFSLALVFILIYIMSYNKRKRDHEEEKAHMKQEFDIEMARTELEVMEHTMQTIGTDLHDNIGQLLSLTSFTLNSIVTSDVERTREKVDSAIALTKKSIREMRLLGKLLQGEQLLGQGLQAAVEQEMEWLGRSEQFHVSCDVDGVFLPENNQEKDLIIFRILQEILNNVIKHAQASLIELSLTEKDGQLTLEVSDNGIGFEMSSGRSVHEGMGLKNISRRARLIGGNTTIRSIPGSGTTITIHIPYL
ncbi:sensor histidine kinase [Mucilaginibacter sp. NFX135]|jgi:two-component system NarL family sensor kinase|uniref:sensor histidine kinase n=1 Tax=Mucilaginibacter sp. NFX135 TaxID=3402687 RepID=UPI003AFA3DFA